MRFLDRLIDRVRTHRPEPRVGEEGFIHAPDAAPEDVINPPRRGNSGPLPERPLFAGPPNGWKDFLGRGTALGPWSDSGFESSYDSGGDSGGSSSGGD